MADEGTTGEGRGPSDGGTQPAGGEGVTLPAVDHGDGPDVAYLPDGPIGPHGHPFVPEAQRIPAWLGTAAAWTWRLLVLLAGFTIFLYLAATLSLVTLPIIIALILATLCVPPARALERRGLPRAAAASIVVIGGLGAFGGFIAALTPAFITQVQELGPTVREALDKIFDWTERTFGYGEGQIMDLIQEGVAQLGDYGGAIAGQLAAGAAIAVQFFLTLSLAIVLLFFFVKDGSQIVDWLIDRSPDQYRGTFRAVGRRAWASLAGFIRGTALVALIDAVGIGIGLAILGVPLVLPIAVLVFFGGFIPVVGAFVTGLIAVLVALADSGGELTTPLLVLAVVVIVQQVESNVLQPVIMRRAVKVHPVVILTALTAGGVLVGVVGAFLAVPIAAVASAVGNELRLRHNLAQEHEPIHDNPDPIGPEDAPIPTDLL